MLTKYSLKFLLWNLLFIVWFIVEYTFEHSVVAVIALALFAGWSILNGVIQIVNRNLTVKINYIIVLYVLFVFICWLNIFLEYSINTMYSEQLLSTLLKNLVFLICISFFINNVGISHFKNVFIYSSVIASIFVLLLTFISSGSFALRGGSSVNANMLAISDAWAICILISSSKKMSLGKGIALIFLSLFCFLSGTRKALIVALMGLVIYFCLKSPKKILRNVVFSVVLISVSYICLLKIPFLYNTIGHRVESLIQLLGGGEGDASANTRAHFIELGLSHFPNSPWLGHGINCFQLLRKAYGTYSHNNYIELLFSVGIIGTVSYYLMHVSTLVGAFKQYIKTHANNAILAVSLIPTILFMDVALVSYYSRPSIIFVMICYYFCREEQG